MSDEPIVFELEEIDFDKQLIVDWPSMKSYKNGYARIPLRLKDPKNGFAKRALIKLPPVVAPFGISKFVDDKNKNVSLSMVYNVGEDETTECKLQEADTRIIWEIKQNSMQAIGLSDVHDQVMQTIYGYKGTCLAKMPKNLNSGYKEYTQLKTTVPATHFNEPAILILDSEGKPITVKELPKRPFVIPLIELIEVWIKNQKEIGVSVLTHQIKVMGQAQVTRDVLTTRMI